MTIRRARADECVTLTRLMHASSAYRGRYAAILEGYAISTVQLQSDHVYLAEEGGSVLGFYSLVAKGDEGELDLMFVADKAQGKGAGRALFDHMRALARQSGWLTVHIVSHPPAEVFYRRMGALRTGTVPAAGKVAWERPRLQLAVGDRQ